MAPLYTQAHRCEMSCIKMFTTAISYYMCYGHVCTMVVDVRKFITGPTH